MSTFKLDEMRGKVSVKSLCNVARQLMATSIRSTLTYSSLISSATIQVQDFHYLYIPAYYTSTSLLLKLLKQLIYLHIIYIYCKITDSVYFNLPRGTVYLNICMILNFQ